MPTICWATNTVTCLLVYGVDKWNTILAMYPMQPIFEELQRSTETVPLQMGGAYKLDNYNGQF